VPGPADERIKRFLEKRAAAAEVAATGNAAQQKRDAEMQDTIARIIGKWTEDSRLIVAILDELKIKLSDTGFYANLQARGAYRDAIATATIVGQIDKRPIDLMLSVLPDGFIHSYRDVGSSTSFGTKTAVQILTANKGEYEALILDALDVD
jgi:hypothetical protein